MANSGLQPQRYSDAELIEFDILIDERLEKAKEQLSFYLTQIEDLAKDNNVNTSNIVDAIPSFEEKRVVELATRQKKLITHLENAKMRIKNKVYGICRETGNLISKERLKAVPHATLSVSAKQKRK